MSDSDDHAADVDLMMVDADDATDASDDANEAAAAVEVVADAPSDQDDSDAEAEEAQEVQAVVVVDDDEEEGGEEGDDDEENDHGGVAEAVAVAVAVVDEDDDEPEAISAPVKKPAKKKKSPKKTPKKSPKKSPAAVKGKNKETTKKRKRKTKKTGKNPGIPGISAMRIDAANRARESLIQTVCQLPVPISDTFTVRSFGQLHVEAANKFSTPQALFPVGYCCDRYEYSPVHGRVLKLRCAILDGQSTNIDHDGPLFRVMWGEGVDEDTDKVLYPYDPYTNSAPVTSSGSDDVVAVPAAAGGSSNEMIPPIAGMRVKVRFDKDQFYYGTISSVEDTTSDKRKKKKKQVKIVVKYDDGNSEEAVYPDPDISLVMPGMSTLPCSYGLCFL